MATLPTSELRPEVPRAAPGRPPEPPRRTRRIRATAVVAIGVGAVYLGWRVTATLNPDALTLSLALWLLEVHAWIGLALFTHALWDVDGAPRPPDALPDLSVAVLIPTYDEPPEVLLPTITAAVALDPPHQTWVLDDGDRPEVAELAARLGARYTSRPDRDHAKAGNLNHALSVVDTDLVAVFDADHVAHPRFLQRTLPYFDDDEVALVQTPQDFYNDSSFEHVHGRRNARDRVVFSEQAVFYREIQPGKNRWGGAFWCGTGALLRTAALGSVGGVATSSITEDIQTTIRLHRRGWRTVYHDEVLARGLAASTAGQYALQRRRWCTGAMQVLREERPLTDRRLTAGQRVTYASTLLGWFDAIRLLGLLTLPLVVLLTGASPIAATAAATFLVAFATSLVLQQHALWGLARGRIRPLSTAVFDLARLGATLRAILIGLTDREVGFQVTPKGASGTAERRRGPVPTVLVLFTAAHLLALTWYVATLLGATPTPYGNIGVVHGAAFWAVVNAGLLVLAVRRSARFAGDRRASHRHRLRIPGRFADRPVTVTDLSLTGAQLELDPAVAPAVGSIGRIDVRVGADDAFFVAEVRSVRRTGDRATVGLAFTPDQLDEQARLALGLFHAGQVGPVTDGERSPRGTERVGA